MLEMQVVEEKQGNRPKSHSKIKR